MGAASDFDEVCLSVSISQMCMHSPNQMNLTSYCIGQDELEAELADLEGEELEAQLLAPTTSAPMTAPARVPQQSSRPTAQSSKTEDDELAALQAEMAM